MKKPQTKAQLAFFLLAISLSASASFYYAHAASFGPEISGAYVEPEKVRPGDTMQVWANASDEYGVSSVTAEMPHEAGSDIVDMLLYSGTAQSGVWNGEWRVHDTLVKNYTTKITARNNLGQESYAYVGWSDPACTIACDSGSGNTCIISAAKSVDIGCYVDDAGLTGGSYNSIQINSGGSINNNTNNASFAINVTGNITIKNGGSITGNANITAANLTIESGGSINANGAGYAGGAASSSGKGPGAGIGGPWGGGAGYGGYGGYSVNGGDGGTYYGNITSPNDFGSGGAGSTTGTGGAGGGLVILNVSGALTNNGSISASGSNGVGSRSGGGSGGAIYISAGNFAGSSSIAASGGSAGGTNGGAGAGGRIAIYYGAKTFTGTITAYGGSTGNQKGGAGTVYLNNLSSGYNELIIDNNIAGMQTPINDTLILGNLTVRNYADAVINSGKTVTALQPGAWSVGILAVNGDFAIPNVTDLAVAGTLALNNNPSRSYSLGALSVPPGATMTIGAGNSVKIENSGLWTIGSISVAGALNASSVASLAVGGTFTISNSTAIIFSSLKNMTINSGGTLAHQANNDTQKYYINLSLENLAINSGGAISASGMGYAGGSNTNGYGPGGGIRTAPRGGGAGFGGTGGMSNLGSDGGAAYGNIASPAYGGSGGASYGGAGGGLVILNVSGALTNNGSISASGSASVASDGGGGSGGGIYIIASGSFAGTGSISSNGGNGQGYGGAGAGGRIAIYYGAKTFTGTITAYGGSTGNQKGGAGTVYLKSTSQTYGNVIIDNNGYAGANTPLNSSAYSTAFDVLNISDSAIVSSALATLPLNATAVTGNGIIEMAANNLVARVSNITMQGGKINSTSGQINITMPNSINSSNFIGTISTSSGAINIWYGSSSSDRCDVSGATITGATPTYYYAKWSNTTAYRCVRAIIIDSSSVMDASNTTRTQVNTNEIFSPSIRIREYNGTDYFNAGGTWNMTVYNSNGSVLNITHNLTSTSASYLWKTASIYNESSFGSYSLYSNVTGASNVGMANYSNSGMHTYSVKGIMIMESIDPAIANPGGNIFVSGKAVLQPDGINVANNILNIYIDGLMSCGDGTISTNCWWNTSWQYRKAITINGSISEQANYQVLINLTSNNFNFSKANSQGNDTRFTWLNTTNGAEQNIPFWIENWTASGANGNATIWVKVPNVTASSVANTTLYMYYGNPSATYNNSLGGNNTFLIFDDFSGTGLDTNKWEILGGGADISLSGGILSVFVNDGGGILASGIRSNRTFDFPAAFQAVSESSTTRVATQLSIGNPPNVCCSGMTFYIDPDINTGYADRTGTVREYTTYAPTAGYHTYSIWWLNGSNAKFYRDSVLIADEADDVNVPDGPGLKLGLGGHNQGGNHYARYDVVFVRSYASPEPSVLSVGTEQTGITTNSTGWYSSTFAAPQTAGNHTVKVNITNANGIYGENSTTLGVRINLSSPSAKGVSTGTSSANPGEAVNISVTIPTSNIGATQLSKVWANVSNSTWSQIYFLSGSASGGTWWNATFSTTRLGQYNATFYANLTGGFSEIISANATFNARQLNISYMINDSAIYTTESALINGTAYREPEHGVSGGTPINSSVTSGSTEGGKVTDGVGQYNFTYTPNPSVTAITYVNFTLNATDSDGIKNYTASPIGAIRVYPVLSKLNVSIYTDRTYYNPGENATIGAVFRNNETGLLLSGAFLKAKIYRNDTGAYMGEISMVGRSGFFTGVYLENFSTTGLAGGWHYINITSEVDNYAASIAGSRKLFYVNNFTSSITTTNESFSATDVFKRKGEIDVAISTSSTPVNSSVYLMNASGQPANSTLLDQVSGSDLSRKILHVFPGDLSGGYWLVNSSTINTNANYSYREKKIFVRHVWWDADTTNPNYWEYRVRVTLDGTLSNVQTNVLVSVTGLDLQAAGVNLTSMQVGSLRVVDPDAATQGNEINGHPVAYNLTNTAAFTVTDKIYFLTNISENSRKTYYVYLSYLSAMATTSVSMDSAGTQYSKQLDGIEDADMKVTRIVTDKEIYDFGEQIYVNASIYTPDKPGTSVQAVTRNQTGTAVPSAIALNDPDGDYVYFGTKPTAGRQAYGYGTWTITVTATSGANSDSLSKTVLMEGTNATIVAPQYIYANDSLAVSGNITYRSSGLNASDANLTIYIEKGGYVQASYTMNADENGTYAHTFPALSVPGDFQVRVESNHSLPQGVARANNTRALEIRHNIDVSGVVPAKAWFPEEMAWINTTAKRYSTGSETIDLEINITNSSGTVVRTLSDSFIFIVSSNQTKEKEWNLSGLPAGAYNITAYLTAPSGSNQYDDTTKSVNQTRFTFYLLNMTVSANASSLMTAQWTNITGRVAYPNGTLKDCTAYISVRGTNDATGLPWSKNITENTAGGQFDNYTKADVPGTFTVYAACYGVNEKGYATAPLEVNLSVIVNASTNAQSYKANTPAYITVNVTNNAETPVSNYVVETRVVNSTGDFIEYTSPKNWTISSLNYLEVNSTQTTWNTSQRAPGNYTAISDVYVGGKKIGSANRTFAVNTTIEAKSFVLNVNASSPGMLADVGITGWINRTGNVVVNGTLDIYAKDYTGAKILDIAYPGEAGNPGKDYVRVYNTTAYQNSPANFTSILQYSYSAFWNTWHFHNGTYTIIGNFTYYDEDGALQSVNSSKTVTIQPAWSASVWFATPANGSSYGIGQTFDIWAYMNNTGNIELCGGATDCEVKIWSNLSDGTNLKVIDGLVSGYGAQKYYVGPLQILQGSQVGGLGNVNPSSGVQLPPIPPAAVWYSGVHIIYINQTINGGVGLQNTTNVTILPIDSNTTLSLPNNYLKETTPNIINGWEATALDPGFDINANIQFNAKWQAGGNIKRYGLKQEISILNSTPAVVTQINKTFDLEPGASTAITNVDNWYDGLTPNGTYTMRMRLYNSSGALTFLCSSTDYTCDGTSVTIPESEENELFAIAATKNASVSANTTNASYNAYEQANISGFVNNTGNVPGLTGYLNLSIFGPSGYYDNISSCDNATFPANNNYSCTWSTGISQNGTYSVNATYAWAGGSASASKIFTINPYWRASASTGTDKAAYNQSGTVNISANITNIGNAPLSGNLTITAKRGASTVATVNQTVGVSVPVSGRHESRGTVWNTGNSEYGSYDIVSVYSYVDENNSVRTATGARTITVNENRSITWSMNTNSDSYKSNQGVNITVDINNTGNAILNSTTLVYTIRQGASTIATYTDNLADNTVTIGEVYKNSWLWNTSKYARENYTVEAKITDLFTSWTLTKNISINETKTAGIYDLRVDTMPPLNYSAGGTIYVLVYGTVNATGNAAVTGNLTLRYRNNRLGNDMYLDNHTGITAGLAAGHDMYPGAGPSTATLQLGVINLTATFTWIDEDNALRSVTAPISVSPYVFYIGGTSVTVSTGSGNTFNPDDSIPLYVNVTGVGGPVTGLVKDNFTISSGGSYYSLTPTETGPGRYQFAFAPYAFTIGDYVISVNSIDGNTLIPGAGATNLYVRDHWVTVRVNANSALSRTVTDGNRGYAAARLGSVYVAVVQRGGVLESVSSASAALTMKQKFSANKFNIVVAKPGAEDNMNDRLKLIASGEFEKYASPSFGSALTKDYHVSVSRDYSNVNIAGGGTFRPGMYNLIIRNDGTSGGRAIVTIERK